MTGARLMPSDPVLPQLASALDARAMRRVFEQTLLAGGESVELTACDIERVKYRPGRNCLIGYKLGLREPATGACHEQRLCAGIYAPDEARARYDKASSSEAHTASARFAPVSLIAPLDMVVWAFPNERKLSALPVMTDPARLREELLPALVRAHWGEDWKIADVSHSVTSYFPEHSCTISTTMTLAHAYGAPHRVWSVLGKTRYDDAGAQTFRCMARLWRGDQDDASYARPLGYQPEHRLLWQERVPGVTLDSLLSRPGLDTAPLVRTARALAALHRTPLATARLVVTSDVVERLMSTEALVVRAQPRCAAELAQATGNLRQRASSLDTRTCATLHGDLHSNNILVDDARVYLIDLDRVSNGPPLAELGSLLAELIYRACLSGTSLDALTPVLVNIVQAYRQAAPWPVTGEEVDWYTAAALLHERAFRCVTSLKPGRMEILGQLVDIAARVSGIGLIHAGRRQERNAA